MTRCGRLWEVAVALKHACTRMLPPTAAHVAGVCCVGLTSTPCACEHNFRLTTIPQSHTHSLSIPPLCCLTSLLQNIYLFSAEEPAAAANGSTASQRQDQEGRRRSSAGGSSGVNQQSPKRARRGGAGSSREAQQDAGVGAQQRRAAAAAALAEAERRRAASGAAVAAEAHASMRRGLELEEGAEQAAAFIGPRLPPQQQQQQQQAQQQQGLGEPPDGEQLAGARGAASSEDSDRGREAGDQSPSSISGIAEGSQDEGDPQAGSGGGSTDSSSESESEGDDEDGMAGEPCITWIAMQPG